MIDKDKIEEELEKIANKYYDDDDEYYKYWRYNGEYGNEFEIQEELCEYLNRNKIEYKVQKVDGFDSCGFSEDFLAIAYNYECQLRLFTIVLECR